jgi:hypothetical protein
MPTFHVRNDVVRVPPRKTWQDDIFAKRTLKVLVLVLYSLPLNHTITASLWVTKPIAVKLKGGIEVQRRLVKPGRVTSPEEKSGEEIFRARDQ